MRKRNSTTQLVAASFAASLLLLSRSSAKEWVPSAAREPSRPVASIPFELYGNLPYLPVSVNGSAPLWFILDSAADSFVISERQAAALKLRPHGKGTAEGTGDGSVSISVSKIDSLRLDSIDLPNRTLIVYPFAQLDHAIGRTIDGVLGSDIFKRFVVELDYEARIVRLYEPKTFRYSGTGEALPIRIDGVGIAEVRATVAMPGGEVLAGQFRIDTGGNAALGLNRPFVDKHRLVAGLSKTLPLPSIGASGESKALMGRIRSLQIGRVVLGSPVVSFSQAARGALAATSNDGLLGGVVLRRFKVIFDYSRKVMILEPNEHLSDAFDAGMTGALLSTEGADLRTFIVREVLPDTPAAEAGLRAGDLITAIDGQSTAGFSLDQINQFFKQDDRVFQFTIRRGEQQMQLELRTRRLI